MFISIASTNFSNLMDAKLFATATLWLGCASDERIANEWMAKESSHEASGPLGGEALAQRKLELDRCYRDLGHFLVTIDAVHRRGDRNGVIMLGEFVDFYIGKHVLPMLEPETCDALRRSFTRHRNLRRLRSQVEECLGVAAEAVLARAS